MSKIKGYAIDVMNTAAEVSELLKRDPIMARQIKEYFTDEQELLDLLELTGTVVPLINHDGEDADETLNADAVARCVHNVPLHKVLEAYRTRNARNENTGGN